MFSNKTVSIFLSTKPDAPSSISIHFPMKARRYMGPRRLLAVRRSRWWPSVISTGTTTWYPGTVHLLSKMLSLAQVVRRNICASSPRRLFQRQRRRLTESLVGEELLGTLWQGCLLCMPSTGQISFHGLVACLALSGFPE